jgi:hypothetical protein
MDSLRAAHLLTLATWGGLVLAEVVLELGARSPESQREAARVHFWLDMLVEAPLLVLVLATGAALAARACPLTPWHYAKIACGLAAVGANLACVVAVVARYKRREDAVAMKRWRLRVLSSGAGIPFALAAAAIGFARFWVS